MNAATGKQLINRAALRRHVRNVMAEWGIERQALPKGAFSQLVADVETAATRLTLAIVTPLKRPARKAPATPASAVVTRD